jgi:radical SAM superfamily enzyme YgiQ (UPF0313 family)
MAIDVLLTYPSDGLRLFQSMIPSGLISIGTVLERAGYRVKVIDFNHYSRDFRSDLRELQPKVIGIGGTTASRMGSFLTARLAKRTLPQVPVVYGGIHATFTAEETLFAIPEIDYVIKGEGELSFLSLCDNLTGRSATGLESIPGLCRRVDGEVIENRPERIQELSLLPISNRDLIGHDYSLEMEFIGGRGDYIMTSRGCPAACNFCAAGRMFPGGVRLRPIPEVAVEIDYLLSRRNLQGLKLFDSTFTANREHVIQFCDMIQEYQIPWECEIRADTVDADLLKLMKHSGCYYVNMGMETTNPALLKRIAKGISPQQVLDVLAICKNLDIRSKVFFTFGHIGQTFRDCWEDIRFIEQHKGSIDFFGVTVGMRVYPGTRLEKESRAAGLLGKKFSWTRCAKSLRNLLLFEPNDIPILFQKDLGPVRLFILIVYLLKRKLICTESFLWRMMIENVRGLLKLAGMQLTYTSHRMNRLRGVMTGRSLSRTG